MSIITVRILNQNKYLHNMNKEKTPKKNKVRAKKFEEKLSINTTLDDVLKVSVPKPKEKEKRIASVLAVC